MRVEVSLFTSRASNRRRLAGRRDRAGVGGRGGRPTLLGTESTWERLVCSPSEHRTEKQMNAKNQSFMVLTHTSCPLGLYSSESQMTEPLSESATRGSLADSGGLVKA